MPHSSIPDVQAQQAPSVLVCGTGVSPHYETIVDGLMDFLAESKVAAKLSDGNGSARSSCVGKAKEAGAESLLYVTTNVSSTSARGTTYSVQCFDAEGKKLWEEEVRGPLISSSVNSTLKKVIHNMNKRLKVRLGKPGLMAATDTLRS